MSEKASVEVPQTSTLMHWVQIVLLTIGIIALFFAQSSSWINNTIFNQTSFTEKTTTVLTSQSSRDAFASAIVDRVFAGRPVADRLLGDRAKSFISNLLGSDLSEQVLTLVANKTYSYLTTPDREDIAIDLSAIRDPLSGIISFVENQGREVDFDPESIPEQITIVESDELPELAPYVKLSALSAGFLWLITLGAFAGYIFSTQRKRIHRAYVALGSIIGLSVVALASGPFVPPAVSSLINNISLRGVANDLTLIYLQPFWQQMYITIGLAVAAILIIRFRWVFVQGWQAVFNAIHSKSDKKDKTGKSA